MAAPGLLCSSGLFTPVEAADSSDFDGGWRSRNDFPHVGTTGWSASPSPVAVVPDVRAAIPLDRADTFVNLAHAVADFARSPDLDGLARDGVCFLPWPRLPTLVRSLPWRMGQMLGDAEVGADACDAAASELADAKMQVCAAVEDLVDGMDISSNWAYTHLAVQNPELCELVRNIVGGKAQRLWDEGSDNEITRGIISRSQLKTIRAIPGRE